eukprot:scaffold57895_cov62-Phaeocystis_antarctica.AAC.8
MVLPSVVAAYVAQCRHRCHQHLPLLLLNPRPRGMLAVHGRRWWQRCVEALWLRSVAATWNYLDMAHAGVIPAERAPATRVQCVRNA